MTTTDPAHQGRPAVRPARAARRRLGVAALSARPFRPGRPDPVQPGVEPLIAAHRAVYPSVDVHELRRAYAVAERMHRGQPRKSGAPYVTHPLAVAMILAAMGMDTTTLVAALLHDTVEDTPYTLGEVRADFGDEIAVLVDGVTKLDGEKWGDRAEAETFRKIVLAAAADLRVLVIKLADRLHNLRTIGFQSPHKRERIANASLELLGPFAERLGIYVLKRELDDLAFAARDPAAHAATEVAVADALADVDTALGPALSRLRSALAEHRVRARVSLRPRHLYSVYRDLGADPGRMRPSEAGRVLIVVDGDDQECYIALGAVHSALRPIPGRVKDFIALPKFNLYQSLHTVVIGPEGDLLDVIVRSRAMHPVAEYGIVAHIRAAGNEAATADAVAGRRDLGWLRQLLTWQSSAPSAEFLHSLRAELATGHVAAFTPAGDVMALPAGATAIDFAYALGTETGDRCIGVLINGRLAALSAEIRSGQVVEILTAPGGGPSEEWLEFATTAQTRVRIQHWLASRRADEAADTGRRGLALALAAHGIDLLAAEAQGESLAIARGLGFVELDDMYAAMDGGRLSLDELVGRFTEPAT
ncbi:RelA/SpoT family protein [Actinomadura alba]|uniref:Bifunctional (P)ppGpp synthetase/guanosine-3',5'-bis(Diphosphate) 3'-pyrophosphohydrolase n=1 Tax=Actinomadura alba TaxID=406431 RepID=A0ABR7LJV5_9ACTN|nr:HD domain-containing protein [Actinomadura alba]MBC6465041.1 bifunctional (p)ppGpp synthetase/guanosine-3',5'-bis(diphosphate) 3'-pyrophosphohydrolase [Actinomadura alba]